jgi:hypothetical protein
MIAAPKRILAAPNHEIPVAICQAIKTSKASKDPGVGAVFPHDLEARE